MAPTTDDAPGDDWATRHARTATDDAESPVVDAGERPASDDWQARHGHVRTVGAE